MKAQSELRNLAGMFSWDIHSDDSRRQDTFIHGQHMIAVDYARNGAVREGRRYEFAKITDPQFREATSENRKKGDVQNWLVKLGS